LSRDWCTTLRYDTRRVALELQGLNLVSSYDPDLRRDTPLALKLKERIRRDGPLPVNAYMQACLYDPEHGYYVGGDPIGAHGDFITAPEISQVFGELLGLWSVVVWRQMGGPNPVRLIEIGPGRGTMMRDALRATSRQTAFREAVSVHLVESSDRLRAIQVASLNDMSARITHHAAHQLDEVEGPAILLANELLDCTPIDQIVRIRPTKVDGAVWAVRTVELDVNGRLQFGQGRHISPPARWLPDNTVVGDIAEGGRYALKFEALARQYREQPMAAIFVDYGHTSVGTGETLQAVRHHAYEHPLTSPGEADLTALVNFAQVADAALAHGFVVDGPVTQAEFLGALGIMERASKLMAANPAKANEIEMGVARLMAPGGMGTRFKAIGIRSPSLPPLPGFPIRG
jgi:NADH dehydrogenase [ubiquinone] 1 alpha subcomplex assembly factor 7